MSPCFSYCKHGGVCYKDCPHEPPHSSGYCEWTDEEAVSREEADRALSMRPGGDEMVVFWGSLVPPNWDEMIEDDT